MKNPKTGSYLSLGMLATVAWFTLPPPRVFGEPARRDARAAEVLQQHIEATGGRAAYEALKTRVSKATLEFKTMGFTANATYFQARSGKSLLRYRMPISSRACVERRRLKLGRPALGAAMEMAPRAT